MDGWIRAATYFIVVVAIIVQEAEISLESCNALSDQRLGRRGSVLVQSEKPKILSKLLRSERLDGLIKLGEAKRLGLDLASESAEALCSLFDVVETLISTPNSSRDLPTQRVGLACSLRHKRT